MPNLKIKGTPLKRVHQAIVEITHGDAKEAMQIPIMQFIITVPTDDQTLLQEWALAPQGDDRWKDVELETLTRDNKVNLTWTLKKAYVHKLEEVEFPAKSGSTTDQGTYVQLTIRGTLVHANTDYDGKNILEVKAGPGEK